MGEITRVKTGSYEEWKELRSHYIGGSDAAAVDPEPEAPEEDEEDEA